MSQKPRCCSFLLKVFSHLISITFFHLTSKPSPVFYSSRWRAQKIVTCSQNYGPLPSSERRDSPKGEEDPEKSEKERLGWVVLKRLKQQIRACRRRRWCFFAQGGIRAGIFSLKHESSIFRSFLQPCNMWFWKCQASSPWDKQYRVLFHQGKPHTVIHWNEYATLML